MGLANVYNAQKKFDQAAEAGAQAQKLLAAAPGGGRRRGRERVGGLQPGRHRVERRQDSRSAEALRAGSRRRPEDGRSALLARHGDVNQGKLPEAVKSFEEYLKLDASGKYAEQAKGMLAAIKK